MSYRCSIRKRGLCLCLVTNIIIFTLYLNGSISRSFKQKKHTSNVPTNQMYESGHLDDELNIEEICPNNGSDIKLLIVVASAISHQKERMAIRLSWRLFGKSYKVVTVFILGRSSYNDDTLNAKLSRENAHFGDLVRGKFVDTYYNLTLKTISALEWIDKHCFRAKFILKTDDDVFLNVPTIISFLENHIEEKRIIFGHLATEYLQPKRNVSSKFYVSPQEYPADHIYPLYTVGAVYMMSSDIIHDLYQLSLQHEYFKFEDIFITGILAQQLSIRRVQVNGLLTLQNETDTLRTLRTMCLHRVKPIEQLIFYKKLLQEQNNK